MTSFQVHFYVFFALVYNSFLHHYNAPFFSPTLFTFPSSHNLHVRVVVSNRNWALFPLIKTKRAIPETPLFLVLVVEVFHLGTNNFFKTPAGGFFLHSFLQSFFSGDCSKTSGMMEFFTWKGIIMFFFLSFHIMTTFLMYRLDCFYSPAGTFAVLQHRSGLWKRREVTAYVYWVSCCMCSIHPPSPL